MDEGATEWRSGPRFPHRVRESSLVSDGHGGVVVIGGWDSSVSIPYLNTFYHLPHANANEWTLMEQTLPDNLDIGLSFMVSDEFCQKT